MIHLKQTMQEVNGYYLSIFGFTVALTDLQGMLDVAVGLVTFILISAKIYYTIVNKGKDN